RNRASAKSRQAGDGDVGEPAAGVPPQLGNRATRYWRISREQEVQPSIVVIIAPGHGTVLNSRQEGDGNIGEPAAGIPPQLANWAACSRQSHNQEVQPSIV